MGGLSKSGLVDQSDLKILEYLRRNSRETMTRMSKETRIPISSVFDRLKRLEAIGVIHRYTSLLDMAKIGIRVRVVVLLKTPDAMKQSIEQWLKETSHVNTLVRINGDWDFMAEGLFNNIHALEVFTEKLRDEFKGAQCSVQYILEDLKREGFVPELQDAQKQ
jgi:DNA-binding Lrp family transcriptional regulator